MRDGEKIISSRIGLQRECIWTEELVKLPDEEIQKYDCIIVDEAQFCPKAQIEQFVHFVDDLNVPVICYGLRADFRNEPFEGSIWLMAWADVIEEIRTVCWCGKAARCNARYNKYGIISGKASRWCLEAMTPMWHFAGSICGKATLAT